MFSLVSSLLLAFAFVEIYTSLDLARASMSNIKATEYTGKSQ